VDRIELSDMRVGGQITAGIDGYDFKLAGEIVFVDSPQYLTAYSAISIDRDTDGHVFFSPGKTWKPGSGLREKKPPVWGGRNYMFIAGSGTASWRRRYPQ
jgi:hypothetical protein